MSNIIHAMTVASENGIKVIWWFDAFIKIIRSRLHSYLITKKPFYRNPWKRNKSSSQDIMIKFIKLNTFFFKTPCLNLIHSEPIHHLITDITQSVGKSQNIVVQHQQSGGSCSWKLNHRNIFKSWNSPIIYSHGKNLKKLCYKQSAFSLHIIYTSFKSDLCLPNSKIKEISVEQATFI